MSRRMFAKAKSTLNSSENLQSGRIRRYAVSTSIFEKLQRPSKIHDSHTILHDSRIFIYGRRTTLLGNKVTGTKVKPSRDKALRLFENVSDCAYLPLLLFSFIIPSPSIDLTEGSPEFSRGSPAVELLSRESSTDRTYSNRDVLASHRIASRCVAVGEDEAAPLGVRKKVAIGDPRRHLRPLKFHWNRAGLKPTRFNELIRIFRLRYPLN